MAKLNHCEGSGGSGYAPSQGTSRPAYANCRSCGKRLQVTRDGRLRAHGTWRVEESYGDEPRLEAMMDKYVVTIYSLEGKLLERIGGFTSRAEANDYAAREFQRSDVGQIHVTEDTRNGGNGRYR